MEIQTQDFLSRLGGSQGVSYKALKSLDKDGDGRLSQAETGKQIGLGDLDAVNLRFRTCRQVLGPLPASFEAIEVYSHAELNSKLFPKGVEGINPNDIQQGHLNDCYFLSALATLAKHRPQEIIKMISDHGDGSYSVKFPGAKSVVRVSAPVEAWAGQGYDKNNQPNGSRWVAVLEKAFVEYVMQADSGTLKTSAESAADTLLCLASPLGWLGKQAVTQALAQVLPEPKNPRSYFRWGGFQTQAFSLLSNKGSDTDILAVTPQATLRSKLAQHLAQGAMITASTAGAGSKAHYLGKDHVYSVLAYDERAGTLTLRNPHGAGSDPIGLSHADKIDDGVFKLSLSEFYAYFNLIAYEES